MALSCAQQALAADAPQTERRWEGAFGSPRRQSEGIWNLDSSHQSQSIGWLVFSFESRLI